MIEFSMDHYSTSAVKLASGDQGFDFIDVSVRFERAAMVIHPDCPDRVRDLILEASNQGWLKPVAYMRQEEWAWARMAGDH